MAVVGMAGRFPGADDIHAFWRNLRDGVESISFFTRGELLDAGRDPASLDDPHFVPAQGELRGSGELDAALFGLTPRDAEILNPQHRLFLECAWAALEHAGLDPARAERPVGVFAGSGINTYLANLTASAELVRAVGAMRIVLANDKDHLASGAAYRLNLRGPAVAVQTACSTSLVAVHVACQSLINGECDVALAGGVRVLVPQRSGYLYTPDGIASPDGHCRAFDADARGTVAGSGAGVVVLKRLEDALAEGDTIHAVIRGSAINNDGAQKVGYTAPSAAGQARVVSEALSVAGVDAATVQYLEAHGSGTPLGDAIELKAIAEVLARAGGGEPCAIGSVKTNVGHLDAAAGVAGLIKTVLALRHGEIPPSLNCAAPHPEIAASGGRVFVNTALRPWARNGTPRRAGVSSFGIGGTNAHVVVEEAPEREPSGASRAAQLLVLSARTSSALVAAAENLAAFLEGSDPPPLADAAFTLQTGRRELEHRLAVVCGGAAEGAGRLRAAAARGPRPPARSDRPVAFLFPGVGMHYVDMGRGLYDAEPHFRATVDECCDVLRPLLGRDLREVLFSPAGAANEGGGGWDLRRLLGRDAGDGAAGGTPLDDTRFAQPALFVTEYALARLWMRWGVRPRALAGHSLGEYVAACLAGVLRLEDALRLVALRARLVGALPEGAMLAVPLGEDALREILPPALDVAAVNTPGSCVVAGPADEVQAFEAVLAERGTVSRLLPARHAFHSRAMAAAAGELERLVAGFELRAPEIPLLSNLTGTWMAEGEARSPAYWARHLCGTVRFADGMAALRREPGWALLEVGPGQTLGAWALQHPDGAGEPPVAFSSLRHQHNRVGDEAFLLETLGGLWTAGVEVDWTAFSAGERRHRVPLPGYPFERRRYWVDPPSADGARGAGAGGNGTREAAGASHEKGPDGMENAQAAQEPADPASPRRAAVLDVLKGIAAELTGADPERVETDADFFRAGFDSLLLLQAIQAIETRMGVRIALVELLEEISTLGALAGHLDRVLPPDAPFGNGTHPSPSPAPAESAAACALPESAAASAPAEAARPIAAPPAPYAAPYPAPQPLGLAVDGRADGVVERVIAQQLQAASQLMMQLSAQQLAMLGGQAAPAAAESRPAAGPPPAAEASPATAAASPLAEARPVSNDGAPRVEPRPVAPSPRASIQPATFVPYQPVNAEGRGGMTPRQQAYLDDFITRYTERTRGSKAHQVRYHLPLADTRVTARFRRAWKEILYPIVSQRVAGSRMWDLDGNEYVDTGMAFGCALFGHAPDFVTRAIREQAERGYGVGPQSPDAGRAAELVCALGGNDRAVFCNSGTEAVMGAIRAARTFTGRTRIACFAGSYHGWSDVVLGRLLDGGARREVRPVGPGISPAPLQDVLMLDWDDPASLEQLARHAGELALVLVEPVQSRRLDIQPRAFLHELRRITHEAGTLLLFDELITGFRALPGGAQEYFGVRADLVTYGKIVAGGLPMGVVSGRREVMDVFDGGVFQYGDDSYPAAQRTVFAGAFFKHPLSMAVACAVLEEVRRQGRPMYDRLNERTARLVERLNAFFGAEGYPVTAVGFSSSFRFFFGPEVQFADLFAHHLIHEGIYTIPETGTHFLSTAHTDDDVERFFQAVRASVEAMRRGGFIPEAPGGGPGAEGDGDAVRVDSALSAGTGRAGISAAVGDSDAVDSTETRSDGVRVLPMSEGQRQLWIESQMGEDANRAYVEATSIRLHGALDVDALRRAVRALVDRHDTLRLTFGAGGDVQLVHPTAATRVEIPLADLRGEGAGEERVAEWIRETVRRPFGLEAGPLVRFALAATGPDEHVLLLAFHHAVLDGWSSTVVMRELGELYAAARDCRAPRLAPPPDHAAQVRAQVAGVRQDAEADAYWRARFADGVPVLELPTDRPRPAVRDYRGERAGVALDAEVTRRLAAAGRPHGLTLFHTLLSAVFVWLARVTGEDDLVVGTPSAGQAARPGGDALVGFDVNVLPLRARVDPALPFAALARRVRGTLAAAVQHQAYSFPRLVETLLRTRDPSRPPVFSVLMHLDRHDGPAQLADLRADADVEFAGGAKVDLTFDFTERPDGLRLRLIYAAALFDAATIGRWLASFARLLEEIADAPETPAGSLNLAGPAELRQVVEEWNRTEHPLPPVCIHELFEAQARRTPDAAAVAWAGEEVRYAELDARANRLAHHLRGRGVGPEDRVALCLERRPELMAAFLGILKAGAAYVPLDPAHPAERLAFMLEDSGARLLLTQSWLEDRLPERRPPTVHLDTLGEALAREPAERPESGVRPENLAYVYYTSGSTGRPKGVAMHHAGPANYFAWGRDAYRAADGRGAPVFSSMAVDLTLANFIPLFAGGPVELLPEGPGVEALADALRRAPEYAMIKITPTHLALLNPLLTPEQAAAGTATLVVGADDLLAEPTRFWQDRAPGVRLLNEYGPTETVVGCSLYEIAPGSHTSGRVPIGRPIWNLSMYVLDAAMQPLPPGIPGELYVGGVGVARGYLGRPALTAEKFVPDPFPPAPGTRLYRTGDRARFRGDGNLEFLGRVDFQVKLRGYRIEPGEVESVLAEHPGVAAAVVVVREDEPGDRRLAAYVVPRGAGLAADELRRTLRERLPEYMVPAAFVLMDELPAGSAGKVDRRALPVPAYAAGEADHAAPRTPVEETLAGIWAALLRVERVGAADDFFALGGHSLLATRVVSRVREVFAVELPLRAVFEAPTLAGMAARVEALRRADLPPLPPVVPVDRARPLPLSFAQERLFFLDRLQPRSAFYNVPIPLRLRGGLDVAALERALGGVVRRHEALRTTFRQGEGEPVQVISPFAGLALPVEDLSGLPPGEREAVARRRADEDASRPFDLEAGPLFRARLLRLGEDDHVLLLGMHHVAGDGWSMEILFRELSALYGAYREGGDEPLSPLPVQYADFAVWQREQLRGPALERQLAWWKERLAGAPEVLELPTDRPRPAMMSYRGAHERVRLSRALGDRLQALARREGATLYMVLLGAFQALLSRWAGTEDVVVGSPIAGRTRAETEGLIGFFVNTLVLRTGLGGDPAFTEVLRRVREVTLGAYEHQEVPFERLVEELRPGRSLAHQPLVQVTFVVQNQERPDGTLPGLRVSRFATAAEAVKFDLALVLAPGPDGIDGVLEYGSDLFARATARRLVRHLERVLEQVADRPSVRLSALELMDAGERRTVLEGWSRDGEAPPAEGCVHHRFQAQARRTPDAPAVVFAGGQVGYGELNRRANRLAHRLRRLGVGPETLVAVCVERGAEMAAAVLAVLKAGGAYVPMDPGYPAERLRLTLADAGVAALVTQERLRGAVPVPRGVAVLTVEEDGPAAAGDDEDPAVPVPAESLAYVVYTSGSTGTPKGVMVSHAGLATSTATRFRFYPEPVGAYLLLSSIAFDSAAAGFFWTLCGGGALVLPTPDQAGDADRLRALATDAGVTHLLAIPSLYAQLLADDGAWGDRLATVVVAGEACTPELVRRHGERFPGVALVNEYGPTEATVWSSAHRCAADADGRAVPIGRPIAGTRSYVLDAGARPLPAGVPGELYVGGAQVARGYLGRPGPTAERFVPDPFAAAPGARMYRTGDRARWIGPAAAGEDEGPPDPRGEPAVLEYLGRMDAQVKIRGFRVEPGEVEAALRGHPAVRECAVVARRDRPGETRLAAYVAGGEGAEAAALRAYLRERLPEHMVPASFTPLPSLPLLPNGKLDRAALPAPSRARAGAELDEPRNYVEARLIHVWEALLGVEGIGATQSFFDLGGSSLLALRLLAQVRRRLGCDLPVASLFAGATVRDMAAAIAREQDAPAAGAAVVPLQPAGALPPLFVLHPADRSVVAYVGLVRHLGADQPVYGVPDVGEDLSRPVARIAAEHVAAIRQVQPRGPYHLVGWSFGGLVAFDMALQLRREGEAVAFLGLLDTVAPELMERWWWDSEEDTMLVLARDVANRVRRPFSLAREELAGLERGEQLHRVIRALHDVGIAPPGFDAGVLDEQCRTVRDRRTSRTGYVPRPFDGTITLFRATDVLDGMDDFLAPLAPEERRTLGWSRHAARVEVHRVPGAHATIGSEPHVRVLARRVRESLAAARAAAPAAPVPASAALLSPDSSPAGGHG